MHKPRYRTILTALTAALILTTTTAATASAALPEFTTQSGKTNMKFTLKGGEIDFETPSVRFICAESTGEAAQTGKKTATATLTLKHCWSQSTECNTPGAKSGEIKTGSLPVELVYISKEHKEAALIFNYHATEPKATFVTWECDGGLATGLGIRGSIIAPITPVNTQTETHTFKFASTKMGLQSPTEYETETGTKAKAFPELALFASAFYEEGDLKGQWTMTDAAGSGTLEIKA